MHMTMKPNIHITGNGSTNGGSYHNVRVMGEAQIFGPLESDSIRSMGNIEVDGSLKSGKIRLIGEASVRGDLFGNDFSIMGQMDLQGSMRSRTIKIRGQLDVRGECEADAFDSRGGFHIHGLLNANEVDIRTWGPCRAKEIGGGRITVRPTKWGGIKQFFSGQGPMTLTAELIEGETIYLENTIADVVRGTHVTIGSGCRIGTVEYRKSLKRSGYAQIKKELKL
ncbi:hypothetical protein [Paenibacillus sp. R14(2021)]|uniref:hypothetical protein n=1 Tax=Paenibacillus sp. R14(2021) TaxID=2859228 RepID=UPI001C614F27|nr:hypothetical protein [Paenibacillus sp. R14(2021)]